MFPPTSFVGSEIMPDSLVIDASALLAVILEEENSDTIKAALVNQSLLAPNLIRYEVANGILYSTRRSKTVNKRVLLADQLNIVWDFPVQEIPMKVWWNEAVLLVQRYDLTFYDAAYAAAASVLKIPLLTLDKMLLNVMKKEKIGFIN